MIDNDYREVDTDEKNVSDVEETKEGTPVETGEVVTDDSTEDNEKTDDFDEFCAMCRRPASKAGKLIHVAPNMAICQDCMQKTFDTMGQMPGIPGLGDINIGDMLSSGKMPNIQFVNMSDLPFGNQQKVKKKKPKEKKKEEPILDIRKIPAPHKIKASLDDYVVGQDYAKKVMSVAVYNHYKRVAAGTEANADGVEIEKSNMLMVGPTGCGKTYLVKTLAKLLDVPLAIADATSLTEAGYIGDDIESVLSKLLTAADNDVEKAERGIVFIDEIDKLAKKKNATQRDVSGESVQQGMLKLLEGAEVEVPIGATSKNAMVPMTTIDTSNILFICGGAFEGIDKIIENRIDKKSIGFEAQIAQRHEEDIDRLLQQILPQDLVKFGLIPELVGRVPVTVSLELLDKEDLIRILTEPKNAIVKQYQKLLELDDVELEFDKEALEAIAETSLKRKTGARGLRAIMENVMMDIMYKAPSDENLKYCLVTKEAVLGEKAPSTEKIEARPESA